MLTLDNSYFGLQPHSTFDSITSDKEVAQTLRTLYSVPNNVELYPGIVVEDGKQEMVPGSGLCPGYTIARTILSDAVALVRGDRFYTIDYNAATLTNWGFNLIQPDKTINGGGVIYKLFQRALPGWYRGASVYAMYPFTQPKEMQRVLKTLKKEDQYDYSIPDRGSFHNRHKSGLGKLVPKFSPIKRTLKSPGALTRSTSLAKTICSAVMRQPMPCSERK